MSHFSFSFRYISPVPIRARSSLTFVNVKKVVLPNAHYFLEVLYVSSLRAFAITRFPLGTLQKRHVIGVSSS